MSRSRVLVAATRSSPLSNRLLAVSRRGDLQYLHLPEPGQFAVLDHQRSEKAFFQAPHGAHPEELHDLIEAHYELPAERVAEFVWAVWRPMPLARAGARW